MLQWQLFSQSKKNKKQTEQKALFCPSALICQVYFKTMWRLVVQRVNNGKPRSAASSI